MERQDYIDAGVRSNKLREIHNSSFVYDIITDTIITDQGYFDGKTTPSLRLLVLENHTSPGLPVLTKPVVEGINNSPRGIAFMKTDRMDICAFVYLPAEIVNEQWHYPKAT